MALWKCSVCGETKEGRCRPKTCPQCGAPREKFEKEQ
ncbi:MAG: radical SAM protein [Firmicutes bacterium]|nr:radical SAM protein [Bacillota bacterium]